MRHIRSTLGDNGTALSNKPIKKGSAGLSTNRIRKERRSMSANTTQAGTILVELCQVQEIKILKSLSTSKGPENSLSFRPAVSLALTDDSSLSCSMASI